ncbi:EF-P beta-lysylation protein EpmB [Accumulibacter sp.]|uniref:EF-P beta-lysylation protein EpmB n=1 Tax=Accumulibacter sp. TaxID=2053492 RepID=UPI0025EFA3E7|nr:EF-P beta-lysylation protein EpmB [Accumulibacter sp.]MCM8595896.1 EF-P beta-lysylation protein EpmB [Accumulibacter sp.]MCM8626471.1 EF-P beta-lysylation protein EpmB [Accumulibacter sp.]MDS4050045.1 EF-P beta-lysylation protein EpmB [Accumulibacter sp.]
MIARRPADLQVESSHQGGTKHPLRRVCRDGDELLGRLGLAAEDLAADPFPAFALRVPDAFIARMRPGDAADPLLRQVLPTLAERLAVPGFVDDPLAEASANRVPGLMHKFAGRVLLIVTGHCPIHCRYCFRRHFAHAANRPSREGWAQAFDYIRRDDSVTEVILSGGDPLSVSDRQLQWLIGQIEAIPHVRRLRIHSRLPVVVPDRLGPGLVGLLAASRLQTSLVIHANHPRELDDSVAEALSLLRREGIVLLNQAVLLAGVNDRVEVLAELSERLFAIGVLPYYLHLLDRVAGAAHFAVPDERAILLQQALLTRLPGYLVPRFVREIAQAPSKVPILASTASTGR